MITYLDNAYGLLTWDDEDKIVCITWKGYAAGGPYREILTEIIEIFKERKATKLLADLRRMKAVTQEDQAWVKSHWLPTIKVAGLASTAMVLPESAIAMLSLNRMMDRSGVRADPQGDTAHFSDMEEAKAWLRSRSL